MQGNGLIRICTGTNFVLIPQKWSKNYKWKSGDVVHLLAGKRAVTASVRIVKRRHLEISRNLYEELMLHPLPISWKTEEDSIRFGPFVAGYCTFTQQLDQPFASNTTFFKDMTRFAHELFTPFYVITPGGFHYDTQSVTGWLYDPANKVWNQAELPWPDFCIKRNISVTPDMKNIINHDAALIELSSCQQLTRIIGTKLDVHNQLQSNPEIARHLPATSALRSYSDLESMLTSFPIVYIKPTNGSQGRGIVRVSKQSEHVKVEFQMKQQTRIKIVNQKRLQTWFEGKFALHKNYLVQQAISLQTDGKGRTADFRWLIQKDGSGSWQITARVARIARAGNITTNLSTGGEVVVADVFLQQAGIRQERIDFIMYKMDLLGMQVANALETANGAMGELGIDFGVSKTGKPWIIEINTRPGRKMLRILDSEVRGLSLRRPLEYAKYTIGFQE